MCIDEARNKVGEQVVLQAIINYKELFKYRTVRIFFDHGISFLLTPNLISNRYFHIRQVLLHVLSFDTTPSQPHRIQSSKKPWRRAHKFLRAERRNFPQKTSNFTWHENSTKFLLKASLVLIPGGKMYSCTPRTR
jgi:hypothetical protein